MRGILCLVRSGDEDAVACVVVVFVIAAVVAFKGGIGYLIGRNKGLGGIGFALGLFLGIIGWIIVACMSGTPGGSPRVLQRCRRCGRSQLRTGLCPSCRKAGPGAMAAAAAVDNAGRRPCPYCAELIMPGAQICRYCQSRL